MEAEKGESRAYQIGVIGCGYLGRSLYDRLRGRRVKVVAIHDSDADKLASVDPAYAIGDSSDFIERAANLDLVVEVAHPSVTETMGEPIIGRTNYMPCSVAALADQALMGRLLAESEAAGTRLYIPHGAPVGIDNLIERDDWARAEITFRKPPSSIDAADVATGDEVAAEEHRTPDA